MQYRNLRIRYIFDQKPRQHRLRSWCLARFGTPSPLGITRRRSNHQWKAHHVLQLMLTTNRIRDQRGGGGCRAGAAWTCAPLLYPVGISIFFDLELLFEFYFVCVRDPQTVRRRLAKFCLKKSSFNISCILNLSQWYVSTSLSINTSFPGSVASNHGNRYITILALVLRALRSTHAEVNGTE